MIIFDRMLKIKLTAADGQQRPVNVPGHEPNVRQRFQMRPGPNRRRLRRRRPVQIAACPGKPHIVPESGPCLSLGVAGEQRSVVSEQCQVVSQWLVTTIR